MTAVRKQALLEKYALPAGCASFLLSMLFEQFSGYGWTDFLAGMFAGLSVVFNLYGLYQYSRARRLASDRSTSMDWTTPAALNPFCKFDGFFYQFA